MHRAVSLIQMSKWILLAVTACSSPSNAAPTGRAPAPEIERASTRTDRVPQAAAPTTAAIEIGDATATATITRVRIVSLVTDATAAATASTASRTDRASTAASDAPAFARADQRVTLYAVIEAGGVVYSDAPALLLGGKRVTAKPLAHAPRATIAWMRVEPTSNNISNGDGPTFHYETIDYATTPIAMTAMPAHGAATDASNDVPASAIIADVRPTLTPDHGHGVGTMRYQLVATQRAGNGARTIASPGIEARRGRASGGLTDAVTRVTIRKDDTYLGYLTEMFNQPYIWASAGPTAKSHQSEHLEGSDCADFVVYGARRMGADIPYMWTGGLPAVTKLLGGGTRSTDGVYRDAKGNPVPYTVTGDMVLFPRHVGVLVEDRGTIGILDDQDLMMHTLFDSPKTEPIADSGYADRPLEVRRFKAKLPATKSVATR